MASTNESIGLSDSCDPIIDAAVLDQLRDLLIRLEFELARDHAIRGDYASAQSILIDHIRKFDNPLAMDLLARVYAQQGLLHEANQMWKNAITLDPNNLEFAEGLAFLARVNKKSIRKQYNWKLLYLLCGLVLFVYFGFTIKSRFDNLDFSISQLQSLNNDVSMMNQDLPTDYQPLLENQNIILNKLSNLDAYYQEIKDDIGVNKQILEVIEENSDPNKPIIEETPTVINLSLNIPGTTLIQSDTSYILRSDETLFLYGSTFTNYGQSMFNQLGQQLDPFIGQIQIKVIGYTDKFEIDKHKLPLNRGVAVVDYLTQNSRLPLSSFTITSGENLPSPYTIDNNADPHRERTVIIDITFINSGSP